MMADNDFWAAVYGSESSTNGSGESPKAWAVFAAELLGLYSDNRMAHATWVKARQVLREFGEIGGVNHTTDLTPANVARYTKRFPERSAATIKGLLAYLKRIANYAEGRRYLSSNPFKVWTRYTTPAPRAAKAARKSEPYHHPESILRVLDWLASKAADWEMHRLYALVALVAYTGVRRDEALYLQLEQCKVEQKGITIARSNLQRQRMKATAEREIPMPDALARVLAVWMPRTGPLWVFPGITRQAPWTGGMPGRKPLDRLKAAGVAVGVEGFTFQSLRHSWTTNASYYWKLSDLEIQAVMGHTTTRTQENYRRRRKAMPLLGDAVRTIDFRRAGGT